MESVDEEEIKWKWALLGLDKSSSEDISDEDMNRVIGVAKKKNKVDEEGRDIVITFKSGLDDFTE